MRRLVKFLAHPFDSFQGIAGFCASWGWLIQIPIMAFSTFVGWFLGLMVGAPYLSASFFLVIGTYVGRTFGRLPIKDTFMLFILLFAVMIAVTVKIINLLSAP